jgi:hypothetical protein
VFDELLHLALRALRDEQAVDGSRASARDALAQGGERIEESFAHAEVMLWTVK